MDYGSQLSRGFKAFKIWSALQTFGVEAFKSVTDHTLDLAQYMAELVEAERDLELIAPVPLTAVCFQIKNASEAVAGRRADLVGGLHVRPRDPVRMPGRGTMLPTPDPST
jgi:glutamate/tyrosine decarboxylase-like PLP-dependent enzyme